jgi:diaminohydroxyphosphoribosylaminopyrimidine deaminase / 5-amino-6-(5-phosphoribosylamino)uracil reductase
LNDQRWMAAALALSQRGRGRTAPNPNVGCILVRDGAVVGRGWTQPGGRPHAEAMALAQAGDAARGATCHVTLEPCAHVSPRGPACADLLIAAGVARVVVALGDSDPRTHGQGIARLRAAGIEVTENVLADAAREAMAGFLARRALGRPQVTLKLATSLDGHIALPSGESRWITGPQARAHAHLERARHEAILVGRRTAEIDRPKLDVRLPWSRARPGLWSSHPPARCGARPTSPGWTASTICWWRAARRPPPRSCARGWSIACSSIARPSCSAAASPRSATLASLGWAMPMIAGGW